MPGINVRNSNLNPTRISAFADDLDAKLADLRARSDLRMDRLESIRSRKPIVTMPNVTVTRSSRSASPVSVLSDEAPKTKGWFARSMNFFSPPPKQWLKTAGTALVGGIVGAATSLVAGMGVAVGAILGAALCAGACLHFRAKG